MMNQIATAIAQQIHNKKSFAALQKISYRTVKARFKYLANMDEYKTHFQFREHKLSLKQLEAYDEVFGLNPLPIKD